MNAQPSGGAIWKLAPNASTPIKNDCIQIECENKGFLEVPLTRERFNEEVRSAVAFEL